MSGTPSNDFVADILKGDDEFPAKVLIVDDQASVVAVLSRALEHENVRVSTATDGAAAMEEVSSGDYDLVVADIVMPGASGIAVLKRVKELNPDTEVIVITGNASVGTAAEAVRHGAADYLLKPFDDLHIFVMAVKRALTRRRLVRLVRKYGALLAESNRKLEIQREKYENLGEVVQVCVGRTIQSIEKLRKELDTRLTDAARPASGTPALGASETLIRPASGTPALGASETLIRPASGTPALGASETLIRAELESMREDNEDIKNILDDFFNTEREAGG